ncbi:MAG: binding domain, excisionase family [Actinomycetia bacterium]|nr:binding domain, excisionase family [Actinomycetes bacterium]
MSSLPSSVSKLPEEETQPLLTPGEVAELFRVDPKTVTRWARSGKITAIRTPGGHRRYRETEVRALLRAPEAPGGLSPRP